MSSGSGGGGSGYSSAERTLKIGVLGTKGVGKTAMVVRFLTGRFIWEYSAEERLYVHHCYIGDDDPDVLLEILDTEAKTCEPSDIVRPLPQADGYLLAFSVADAGSFDALSSLLPRLPFAAPCVPVATKADLEPHREVSHDAVVEFCALWNLPRCSVTSALEDAASAEEPFVRVCREVLGKRGCSGRKRKPSAKIFESLNKMLGQIVLQKQP